MLDSLLTGRPFYIKHIVPCNTKKIKRKGVFVVQRALFKNENEIFLIGPITVNKAEAFSLLLPEVARKSTSDTIFLYINSEGGSGIGAMKIFNALRQAKKMVTGIVVGRAHSAAAFILQGCDKRKTHPRASFLMHDTKIVLSVEIPEMERMLFEKSLYRDLDIWKFNQQKMDYTFAERAGRPVEEIRERSIQNKKMSAQEALAFGLIDEIIME